ncbi:Fc.00g092150.m01.CDS01 [Cosmosporella sp. VM-42]
MSSQKQGITVSHVPDDRGYRLIELPPELQSLLESDTAPVLTIEADDASALLKTPNKTYALRQKNTSNALILLSPHTSSASPEQGLALISSIQETVELDVVPEKTPGVGPLKNTGSKGKWHEKFGRNR